MFTEARVKWISSIVALSLATLFLVAGCSPDWVPTKTTQDVFSHHLNAFASGNLDELLSDYSDNAFLLTRKVML